MAVTEKLETEPKDPVPVPNSTETLLYPALAAAKSVKLSPLKSALII